VGNGQERNECICLSPCAEHQKCEIKLLNKYWTDWQDETWVWKVLFRALQSNLECRKWVGNEQERNECICLSPCAMHQKCEIILLNKGWTDWRDETWVWKVWFGTSQSNLECRKPVENEQERNELIYPLLCYPSKVRNHIAQQGLNRLTRWNMGLKGVI